LLSRFEPLDAEEVRTLSNSPEFLLDCEYCDDPMVRRLAAIKLGKILGSSIAINTDAPDVERGEMIERLRSQLKTARPAAQSK